MVEIEIFLSNDDEAQVSFLSIPLSDIERLAIYPFRWIRYVMFAICGARGDLSTTPDGPLVDYDRTEIVDTEITYYYRPSEACAFVDYECLNDQSTSTEVTELTPRHYAFRNDVIQRDGHACVITQEEEGLCEAVHLIPRSKGEEYIARVIHLRSPGDNSAPPLNAGINDIINGILVRQDLHTAQGKGEVAFLKTPNYGLRPEDIKRFPRGDPRPDYITLQRLKKPANYNPEALQILPTDSLDYVAYDIGVNVDALFQGDGNSPPSTVILDYVYGVAAYKSWRSNRGGVLIVMSQYREKHYAQIPPFPRFPPDDSSAPNDPVPRKRYKARRGESRLAEAIVTHARAVASGLPHFTHRRHVRRARRHKTASARPCLPRQVAASPFSDYPSPLLSRARIQDCRLPYSQIV